MRVASVGCFPGAWRRGSWHFQAASLHLPTIKHGPLVSFTYSSNFTFLEQAWRATYAAREAKRLVTLTPWVYTSVFALWSTRESGTSVRVYQDVFADVDFITNLT